MMMMSLDNRKYYQDFFVLSRIRELKFRKFFPTRPDGAEALSPGQRPGLLRTQTCRPVRAKALKYRTIYKAFALTGRLSDCHCTQGDALG
nr:hypothetical protein [uncultured Prevotella sp.]